MKIHIYIIIILLFQLSIAQEMNIISNIPSHINGEKVINNYIFSIGGHKKLNKIKTLKKIFNVELDQVSNFTIEGEILYKKPNLYSSTLTISTLGQVQSTKYDGENCILKRFQNDQIIEKKIEGKELQEKLKDFDMFPILEEKTKEMEFKLIEIHEFDGQKIYKIYVNNNENDTTYLFFDSKTKYLIKKQIINKRTEKITNYKDYKQVEGIMFPFLEISTINIDNKIAQKSVNIINDIIINSNITIDKFQ